MSGKSVDEKGISKFNCELTSLYNQAAFTCSMPTVEILEQSVKYFQS